MTVDRHVSRLSLVAAAALAVTASLALADVREGQDQVVGSPPAPDEAPVSSSAAPATRGGESGRSSPAPTRRSRSTRATTTSPAARRASTTTATVAAAESGNPFAARAPWPAPTFAASASKQADTWRSDRPDDARLMERLSAVPTATWLGPWSGDVRAATSRAVEAAASAGQEPVLVLYDIPQRDCGGYSAGGAAGADEYRRWIRSVAEGLGQRPATIIVEPDALAALDCLDATSRSTRLALLDDAVTVLAGDRHATVYLDAGHVGWHDAPTMAARLRDAGVAKARGFSLGVSNFNTAKDELAYGDQLVGLLSGAHFVVDVGRSGAGSNGEWCNPQGRALGPLPTAKTGDPHADALLWIKAPGESDGECGGGPRAGEWWPDYALGLARRAWG